MSIKINKQVTNIVIPKLTKQERKIIKKLNKVLNPKIHALWLIDWIQANRGKQDVKETILNFIEHNEQQQDFAGVDIGKYALSILDCEVTK